MKKLMTTLSCFLAVFAMMANHVTVSSKADFEAAFFAERTNDQCDTIFVKSNGTAIGLNNGKNMPNAGKIWIIGVDNEEGKMSGIKHQWNLPINQASDKLSVFFENIVLQGAGGTANSKYYFQTKDTNYHYIDTLKFTNCVFQDYNRALFRVQPAEKLNGLKDAGDINYFGIEGCTFRTGYQINNPMSMFRMDMRVAEMVFRENLFYDLGYVHSLIQFATMSDDAGRVDIDFTFENNIFIGWNNQNSLMMFDQYVGPMSSIKINNNMFLVPNWYDAYNNSFIGDSIAQANPDTLSNPKRNYIASVQYGMVEFMNNVLVGYKGPRENITEDGEGAWLMADTIYLTQEDHGFDWSIFTDAKSDLFNVWKGEKVYTAGVEGAPIGVTSLYTDEKKSVVNVTIAVEGSKSAIVKLNEQSGVSLSNKFITGDEITIEANRKGMLNKFLGWSDGVKDAVRTITLTSDLNLTAQFEEQPYIAVWNLEQLDKNNVKLDAPLAANYAAEEGVYFLKYATHDGTQYIDSTTQAIMTRNNKISNDYITDLRNCLFIHSDSATFADKTPADYIYFEIPSVEAGSYLMFNIGTDNSAYKTTNVDVSLDGTTWETIKTADMYGEYGHWIQVTAEMPASLNGKKAWVRIKGDETSGYYSPAALEASFAAGTAHRTTEYLFVSEIFYVKADFVNAIPSVNVAPADENIYDIFGRRVLDVDNLQPGLYIQAGKKFMIK